MTALLNKYKKPLLFVLVLAPIAIVGGFFTGVYGWAELTDDVKSQILAQIGNNPSLYYLITTMQTLVYALIFGFFGYILSEKTGLMKPVRFEKKPMLFTIGMTLFTGLVLCADLFYFRNHIPQVAVIYQDKPSFAYWMASVFYGGVIEEILLRLFMMSLKHHCCASLRGRSSAVYDADVWRNNTNDSAAMLSSERCWGAGFRIPVSKIRHSVFHDGTRRGTYRMEDNLDHIAIRTIRPHIFQ